MKRLIILAVLCAFVLSAAVASAADIKATGTWIVEANWNANWAFDDDIANSTDTDRSAFGVSQRADTIFEFIANENLKGVLYTRIGTAKWGQGAFDMGNTNSVIGVRRAFLDFNYPGTDINVRAGYQAVSLPNAFGGGSLILDEEIGSAVVSGAITDNVGFLVGYARATDGGNAAATNKNAYVDGYIAALPLTFDGISLTPFGMYSPIGTNYSAATAAGGNLVGLAATNASTNANGADFDNAYWLGAAFTMDLFDPFVVKADFNYGKVDSKIDNNKRSGWLFDAALEYKGWDFMTPEVFFTYTSGEDGNASKSGGKSERMPVLAAQNWAIGSFFFGGDRLLNGSIQETNDYMGFWALGLSLKDIQSFAEGLTHDFHLIYAQGTNDKNAFNQSAGLAGNNNYNYKYGRTLTEDDSLWEVDFNTGYKLYDGLTLSLDLGYLNLDTKKERWDNTEGQKGGDAWKVSTGIMYQF
ncbi:MAG: outer membrane homotrimeric porin [Pseudodesulfovibrio sp.]